jgi:hypothetical protein
MDRDRRTRTGARAPGAESDPHSKAAHRGVVGPAQNGTTESDYEVREGQKQTRRTPTNAGSRLKRWMLWKALSEMPAFQPYWGKPAVRNDRGDSGNVGIIRSPLRATVLPDCGGRSVMIVPTATTDLSFSPKLTRLSRSSLLSQSCPFDR